MKKFEVLKEDIIDGKNNTTIRKTILINNTVDVKKENVIKKKSTLNKRIKRNKQKANHYLNLKFRRVILLKNEKPKSNNKATISQFQYIYKLLKDQIGKIQYNSHLHNKYMTKKNAMDFIELLNYHYYDITVKFIDDVKK